ncbi:glycosyltransferase family 4 protein [Novosphingobium sp.]|uniref:glycosyltransferase family 4 protein n=1 Tax=Novosphingobium sp. TaxID=1874826 RepID=UPI00286DB450|nr:glycosyltransferase family 4 protein [Novosphingobium sp.]
MAKPFLIHVSADFPDKSGQQKTPVIARLVAAVSRDLDQQIYSLNRVTPPLASWPWPKPEVRFRDEREDLCSVLYSAPPRGIHHLRLLRALGESLAERIGAGNPPDLIIGHKLTVEGIAVARAAQLLDVPYALSIQGNTDAKILSARPDLREEFARIFHDAAVVFPFAPWALARTEAILGQRSGPTVLLPCLTEHDIVIVPEPGSELVSAFHLHNYRLKNLPRLASAVSLARQAEPPLQFTLYGGGDEPTLAQVRRHCGQAIGLGGHLPGTELFQRIHAARGFAMPSLRESFGLVFIEALMAGTPILYPRGAAVDGWFAGCSFALPVDARDTAAIAAGLLTLYRDEERLKADLAAFQAAGGLAPFGLAAVRDAFAGAIRSALPAARPSHDEIAGLRIDLN